MRLKDLQQTYRRDDAAAEAALAAIVRELASDEPDTDPFDTPDGFPNLPEAEDAGVAETK